MKPSDSTNSLTELTGRDECFVCLDSSNEKGEPLVSSKLLRTCGCKFFVHPDCWNQWMKGKTDFDCPICRKASVLRISIPPNPVLLLEVPRERRRLRPSVWCLSLTCVAGIGLAAIFALWGPS